MMELTIYGLMGLAAMLVIAFCPVYADELSPLREQSSYEPNNNAHVIDPPAIKAGMWSPALTRGPAEDFHG